MPPYSGRNRPAANGGPQGVERSYASTLKEREALFESYEHLRGLPRGDSALTMLRKVASQVKPIMRKRGWKVQVLAEFLPPEQNLLGLNINKGYKICIRLRYHHNPDLFLPLEQVVDTMLHELSHNVWGDHDSNFHRLWDQLRDEYETLLRKGYTGEGFLSEGHTLGGRGTVPPPNEMRRLARESAEKRKAEGRLTAGSGRRLGGTPLHIFGTDIRNVIADQITRRNTINKGCASGREDANKLSQVSSITSFKTQAEEDDANNRAIAQALYELMQEEEEQKLQGTFSTPPVGGGLGWHPEFGLYDPDKRKDPQSEASHPSPLTEDEQFRLALDASLADQRREIIGQGIVSPVFAPPDMSSTAAQNKVTSREVAPSEMAPDQQTKQTPPDVAQPGPAKKTKRKRLPEPAHFPKSGEATASRVSLETLPIIDLTEPFNPNEWSCDTCTFINPTRFLACDVCGSERPQPKHRIAAADTTQPSGTASAWQPPNRPQLSSLGWNCSSCGAFMEHKWWTCSACGTMKATS